MQKARVLLLVFVQVLTAQDNHFKDVAILLQNGHFENYNYPGRMSISLINLIHDKNVPIIVEGALLHCAIKLLKVGIENYNEADFQYEFSDEYIKEANFKLQDWRVYKHKKKDFYLLLPVIASSSSEESNIEDGFMIKNLNLVKSEDELRMNLSKYETGPSPGKSILKKALFLLPFVDFFSDLSAVKDFFVSKSGKWNIFLDGYSHYYNPIRHFMLPKGMTMLGSTCGLSPKDFSEFLSFCANDIETFSLFINSRCGGVTQLKFIDEIMKHMQKPFIFISNSALDGIGCSIKVNIKKYFDEMRRNADTLLHKERQQLYGLLSSMFRLIRSTSSTLCLPLDENKNKFNLISVRLPDWTSFKTIQLNDRYCDLDEEIKNKEEREKLEKIEIDKPALLLTSEDIDYDINLKSVDTIFSMVPGASIHRFKKINTEKSIKEFLRAFGQVLIPYKKLFLVNELTTNGETFKNIVIYRNPKKFEFCGHLSKFEIEMLAEQQFEKSSKPLSLKLDLSDNLEETYSIDHDKYKSILSGDTQLERKENWIINHISLEQMHARRHKLLDLVRRFQK